jgi:hypothetical protein
MISSCFVRLPEKGSYGTRASSPPLFVPQPPKILTGSALMPNFSLVMLRCHAMWVGTALLLFTFFVIDPLIAAAIGYAAWKGEPKNFDREMYWIAFAAAVIVSGFLMVFAQRMHADVRTWQYPIQVACFCLGALLFGVGGGCMIGIFTYRRGVGNQDPPPI